MSDQEEQGTGTSSEFFEDLSKRLKVDRPWSEYPVGTKAFAINGGHWSKVERGWQWCSGSTFPTPAAEASHVQLPTFDEWLNASCPDTTNIPWIAIELAKEAWIEALKCIIKENEPEKKISDVVKLLFQEHPIGTVCGDSDDHTGKDFWRFSPNESWNKPLFKDYVVYANPVPQELNPEVVARVELRQFGKNKTKMLVPLVDMRVGTELFSSPPPDVVKDLLALLVHAGELLKAERDTTWTDEAFHRGSINKAIENIQNAENYFKE